MVSSGIGSEPHRSETLDIFRGFAAVFMVVNHAGFRLWASASHGDEWSAAVLLLSSFAPGLFFFATGVGIGLRSGVRSNSLADTSYKAGLLVLADQLGAWRMGAWWTLDFFSFIGLSMLTLTALARSRQPVRNAALLFCAVILLRFVIGPSLKGVLPETGWSAALIGVHGQRGVSYPVSPWICFPLAGFLLARACPLTSDAWRSTAYVSVVSGGFALALAYAGASFFRWGTMSLSFFVLSVPVLAFTCLLAQAIQKWLPNFGHLIALRGVSAFLVVPVHYAVLEVFSRRAISDLSGYHYGITLLALLALSFAISKGLDRAIAYVCRFEGSVIAYALFGLAAACIAATIVLGAPGQMDAFATATVAQFMVAFGLAKRLRNSRSATSSRLA